MGAYLHHYKTLGREMPANYLDQWRELEQIILDPEGDDEPHHFAARPPWNND
jgi:hypothetical protein